MSLRDVIVVYLLVGVACAVAVVRRAPARGARLVASAALTVPLWPLWAPFALSGPRSSGASGAARARIERALGDAVSAVAGTELAPLFPRAGAARISAEVARLCARLDGMAAASEDSRETGRRVEQLVAQGAPERVVATARRRHETAERLEALAAHDRQTLDELAELLEALRAQLVLARYGGTLGGSSPEGAGALVTEVWARLEAMTAIDDSR